MKFIKLEYPYLKFKCKASGAPARCSKSNRFSFGIWGCWASKVKRIFPEFQSSGVWDTSALSIWDGGDQSGVSAKESSFSNLAISSLSRDEGGGSHASARLRDMEGMSEECSRIRPAFSKAQSSFKFVSWHSSYLISISKSSSYSQITQPFFFFFFKTQSIKDQFFRERSRKSYALTLWPRHGDNKVQNS